MEFNDFYTKYSEDIAAIRSTQNIHEKHINDMHKEIDQLKSESKALYEINTNVRLLAENMNTVKTDIGEAKDNIKEVKIAHNKLNEKFDKEISEVKNDINDVKVQPTKAKADWWDKVVWLVVGGGLSAVVALVLEHI